MSRWRGRLYKTNRVRDFDHESDRNVRARQIYQTIDRQKFQWIVVLVAGVGFYLDGYTLFASNIVLPMIAYVYWRDELTTSRNVHINIATLAGVLLGQLSFGFLADKYGRKRMYGAELLLLIAATLGLVMSSEGAEGSMSVFAWLTWWRVIVGIGVGADYPLSAVITAELSPTKYRAVMMSSVFFMQALGQISGNLVSIVVIAISRKQDSENLTRTFDQIWRWIIGIGVVPGVLGVIFRFTIPETPRFILDIEDDPVKAEFDASALFGDDEDIEMEVERGSVVSVAHTDEVTLNINAQWPLDAQAPTLNSNWTLSKRDIIQYFWTEKNIITLIGTMLCWLILDFGFYSIGLSSPKFLARTWGTLRLTQPTPSWKTTEDPNVNLFDMFFNNSVRALLILNAGSFVGGLLMISFAGKVNRVTLQKYGFLALAALLVSMGTMFLTSYQEGAPAIVLYVLCQMLFNFGPNTTTYILPAELFPTRYRATCHGLSAAMGKVGSILGQVFSEYYRPAFGSSDHSGIERYGTVLIVFSAFMVIGALVTHFTIPDVQEKGSGLGRTWGGKSKTLEQLATGRAGVRSEIVIRARHRSEVE